MVIKQIPFVLLFAAALFSVPALVFALTTLLLGIDAEGQIFCLIFGLFILWLFLEFVATRERIEIDLDRKTLSREVSGLFRIKKELIDLGDINAIGLEIIPDTRGRKRQYLYMYGTKEKFLLNSPAKVYLNQDKLGTLLTEATQIPYRGRIEV